MLKLLCVYYLLNILTNKSRRRDVCESKRCICKFSWKANPEFMKTSICTGKKIYFSRILLIQLNTLKYVLCGLCAWSKLANSFYFVNQMLTNEVFSRKLQNHSYLQKILSKEPSHKLNRVKHKKRLHKNMWCLINSIFGINWGLLEVRMENLSLCRSRTKTGVWSHSGNVARG